MMIDYDKVGIVSQNDSRLIEFLAYKLNEIPTWTKEKQALLDVINQRLSQLNAYTYEGKTKTLLKIGDWSCGSSYSPFFKGTLLEGKGFFQIVTGYSKSQKSKLVIKLIADIQQNTCSELFRLFHTVDYQIHALWEFRAFDKEVFRRIKDEILLSGPVELGREDAGMDASWCGLDVVGEEESLQESLYVSLEGVSPDLMNVGGFYPEIRIHLIQTELLAIEVINPFDS